MPTVPSRSGLRMRALLALLWLVLLSPLACAAGPTTAKLASWREQAQRVSITRDEWGIAHVHGKTDADAVFGMIYAQAEDDFNRVETNYLVSLGRLAEVEGEKAIWQDLRQRMYYDEATLKANYAASPDWLKKLMAAWADGLNYFLATHPEVKPRLITRFEPWMTMSFTEGSIGGDIEAIPLSQLQAFYEHRPIALTATERELSLREPRGSNGIAIAPKLSRDRHALLLINPHTSFFFRSELQMRSDEGLDAYGAVTWGQFFVYQGFNRRAGWMHTTSGVDRTDEFAETIVRGKDGNLVYRYGDELRPLQERPITLAYRKPDGRLGQRSFLTYATHHGPIVRQLEDGRWIAFAMMDRPVQALQQSFLRTKATSLAGFLKVAKLQANSSNDTLYADADGAIAYLHPQFVPVRNPKLDYRQPVDGSDPGSDWRGMHALNELPQVISPANGWVFNVNNWPWTAAGADSPKREDFPPYMDQAGENPRGPHAVKVLQGQRDFTLQKLIDAAYDSWLPAFADMIPSLAADYDALPANDSRKAGLAAPVALLRTWDARWALDSTAMTLAQFWGDALWPQVLAPARQAGMPTWRYASEQATPEQRLGALQAAVDKLTREFGNWQIPWREVNRYQRNDGAIVQTFDDAKPSLPVPFASSKWGSLASFGARAYPGTKRLYGTSGNSFVAVVEFSPDGPRARAVSTGGESGDPTSPHFSDQALRYADGNLRPVHFMPEDIAAHAQRRYHPGES